MKKLLLVSLIAISSLQASAFTFNGVSLTENTEFTQTTLATIAKKATTAPEEISGMACSRTTEGYFWVHSDDGDNKIYALGTDGKTKYTLTLSDVQMRDWEDICIATVNDKNYILLGVFGDNDAVYKDNYYIYRFEEPAITEGGSNSIPVEQIKFGYPGGAALNAETIMYDPVKNKIYIVNKIKDAINSIYEMPYQESYSGLTVLSKVQDLGKKSEKFNFLTAGDISQDGMHILIKSKTDVLYWKRQGTEDLSATFARNPEHINAYEEETQGEAITWDKNATAFYTCSDVKAKDDTNPIFKYERPEFRTSVKNNLADTNFQIQNGQLITNEKVTIYNLSGQIVVNNAASPVNTSALRGIHIVKIGASVKKVIF